MINSFFNTKYRFNSMPFNWINENWSIQQRIATHDFPSKNGTYAEQMGFAGGKMSIETLFDDKRNFDRFYKELQKGEGFLFSEIFNKTIFVKIENIDVKKSMNAFHYTVSFNCIESLPAPSIRVKNNTEPSLQLKGKTALNKYRARFATAMASTRNKIDLLRATTEKIQNATANIGTLVNTIGTAGNDISGFNQAILGASQGVNALVRSPELLFDQCRKIFFEIGLIAQTPLDLANTISKLFGFGKNDNDIGNGNIASEITQNKNAINTLIKANSFLTVSQAVPNIEFDNARQLEEFFFGIHNVFFDIKNDLEKQFNDIDLENSFFDIFTTVESILNEQRLKFVNMQSIYVENNNSVQLNYLLYDNLDKKDSFDKINNIISPLTFSKDVWIL